MPNIGTGEIVLLLLLALLLFGAKRLPEIGRSLGSGMREFKDSVTGKSDDTHTELPVATPDPVAPKPQQREPVSYSPMRPRLAVPRARHRAAAGAPGALVHLFRLGAARGRDRVRLLRRAAGGRALPHELRQVRVQHPAPCKGLLLVHDDGPAGDGRRLRVADLRARARAARD